jgi:hypothetical protein
MNVSTAAPPRTQCGRGPDVCPSCHFEGNPATRHPSARISTGSANGGPPDREGQVTAIAVAWLRRPEKRVAASAAIRSSAVRWADANSDRDRIDPAPLPQLERTFCLAERNSQQARAQEHEAGRGQGKKSVGDNVVVAHDTPTTQMLVRIY